MRPASNKLERKPEDHLGLVYVTAKSLERFLAITGHKKDALWGVGTLALMSAWEEFDPKRGKKFSSFAIPKIIGAMRDEIRRLDTVSRVERRHISKYKKVWEQLSSDLERAPTTLEMMDGLGIHDRKRIDHIRAQVLQSGPASIHVEYFNEEKLFGHLRKDNFREIFRADLERILRSEISKLSPKKRTVIELHFFEGVQQTEIAVQLGITKSGVSQAIKRALNQIRESLQNGGFSLQSF
jgi:RNA polymerase sigma factor (sigma-70 family)